MIDFVAALRTNTGLTIVLSLAAAGTVILTLVAHLMRRAGASVRPVIFVAGLIGPIVGTLFLAEMVRARRPPTPSPVPGGLTIRDGRFADRETLFGSGVIHELIRDVKADLPGGLDQAEHAEAGVTREGETVLIAQFASEEQTRQAAGAYEKAFHLGDLQGNGFSGWRAKRGLQGDYVELQQNGRTLFVWSGLTPEAAASRRAKTVTTLPAVKDSPTQATTAPLFPSLQFIRRIFESTTAKAAGVIALVLLYVGWFFRGAVWAGSVAPVKGAIPVSVDELRSRLQALNQLDVPFQVTQSQGPRQWVATWRFTEAKWMDVARARGVRRGFQVQMRLDEASRTVRATDYVQALDWSTVPGRAAARWKVATGHVFFQMHHPSPSRLEPAEHGLSPAAQDHRFDLREMKSPLIQTVTAAGWTWRPGLAWSLGAPPDTTLSKSFLI